MSDTATVETLVAEVRTLMVGSRQVTLSVAKQLDTVPLAALRIFGRVRMAKGENHVIGAAPDGTLALAVYNPGLKHEFPWSETEDRSIRVCIHTPMAHGADSVLLRHRGRPVEVSRRGVVWCIDGPPTRAERDGHPDGSCGWAALHPDVPEWFDEAITEHDRAVDLISSAEAAPLIVLAGLK